MKTLVCVKQVPDTTEIRIDPVTNTLIRDGVPSIVNTFDAYALELALRLKDRSGGTVTVLSMGPPQAAKALRQCLAMGADEAVLVSDRAFGGSDTLATSGILAAAIGELESRGGAFDLIFCGKQAIDGDTAQVGPEIAEHRDIPQITYVTEVVEAGGGRVAVKRESDEGYDLMEAPLPCLLSVTKTAFEPRYGTVRGVRRAHRTELGLLTAADLRLDPSRVGLKGSPTMVKRSFTPSQKKAGVILREEAAPAAVKLADLLEQAAVL